MAALPGRAAAARRRAHLLHEIETALETLQLRHQDPRLRHQDPHLGQPAERPAPTGQDLRADAARRAQGRAGDQHRQDVDHHQHRHLPGLGQAELVQPEPRVQSLFEPNSYNPKMGMESLIVTPVAKASE
eukprot:scaffold5364_cov52-Phaeocystis_antarctica.AAC.1